MGASGSTEIGGVRVFKVNPGSPAAEAGLEVFFDFITEINGAKLDPSSHQIFAEKIQESENALAKMTVYNTRAHSTREVAVTPRKWAGSGLLGAKVKYDSVDPAENHGVRVLEVFPNSPAAHAGLVPFQDYLLGTDLAVFHDIDELVEAVTMSINERMQVYVYNCDSESVREVLLKPNNDWGGEGCIGCDIGTGLLHRIPAPRRPPGAVGGVPTEGTPVAASWPPAGTPGIPTPVYPPGAVPGGPYAGKTAGAVTGAVWAPPVAKAPLPERHPDHPTVPPVPLEKPTEKTVGRITWPPPMPKEPPLEEDQATSDPQAARAPEPPAPAAASPVYAGAPAGQAPYAGTFAGVSPVPHSVSASELPRAPPGTPLNDNEVPPAPDLTLAMDSAKLAAMANDSGSPPMMGGHLYPVASAEQQATALL